MKKKLLCRSLKLKKLSEVCSAHRSQTFQAPDPPPAPIDLLLVIPLPSPS